MTQLDDHDTPYYQENTDPQSSIAKQSANQDLDMETDPDYDSADTQISNDESSQDISLTQS